MQHKVIFFSVELRKSGPITTGSFVLNRLFLMSSEQRDEKILWSLRSEFILGRFAEASENVQLHGKFMHSSGWVQCIHDHYDIPGGYEFTKQDLAKALRNRYKETLDNRDIANDHGICRDHKKEVDPLTNDRAKVDQWYFAVVPPGAARPLPRGGGAWYDDVWIKPPEKMSPRNLATNVSPGGVDVVARRAEQGANAARATAAAAQRPSTRSNPSRGTSRAVVGSKRKAGDEAQRSAGGKFVQDSGKKAKGSFNIDDIMKEKVTWQGDEALFPMNADGVSTRRMVYEAGNNTVVVVLQQQQQQQDATFSDAALPISCSPKDNHIEWTSAKELKKSLADRSDGLSKEEMDMLRVLTQSHVEMEGKTKPSKVILPKGQGQSQETIYIKQPPKRVDSQKDRSLNEVASISKEMSESIGLDLEDVIDRIATYVEGNCVRPAHDGTAQLIHQSTALITEANLSLNQYHLIRMYVARVWKLKIGAPVMYMRDYMSKLCPKDTSHISQEYLETGTNKKYQYCTYWYDKTPRDGIAGKVLSLLVGNKLVQGTAISTRLTDDELAVALNIDKGSDRTTVMLRVLHEVGGNKGESSIVIGEMGDGANECYDNLQKCFFSSETHVVKQFLQNLADDELHLLIFDVEDDGGADGGADGEAEVGKRTKCCTVIRRDHSHANIALPESITVIDVNDEKYLASSIDTPDLEPNSDIVLLRRQGKAVAVGSRKNNAITAWTSLYCGRR